MGRGAIARRLESMRLRPIHRGVYAVGHRKLSGVAWCMAAVLAYGADAVPSHRSAAAMWGILEGWRTTVDITLPRRVSSRAGIRTHLATIVPDEWTLLDGIPVTTPARTLLDLAAVLQPHELNRALERAEGLRLADGTPLVALLERHHRRRGTASLKAAMKDGLRPAVTKSELERRFLSFLERAGLPRPETNVLLDLGGEHIEVDCVWREARVIVELDSRAWHLTTEAFERDRERDRRAQAAGWRPIRITDRALRQDPAALVAVLGALLSPAAPARSA